ncbi:MAG: 4Fe-4S binding protein [Pontiellaceae bacterium]|nr:4Fe-4S binding protein [Pontiellaceae bacterium]MBN2784705.1 4Fe-4S binding protein [Pontiellaceae bacterium]
MNRRKMLRYAGELLGAGSLGAMAWRIFSSPSEDAEFIAQSRRFAWQIDPDKCRSCGLCATACVRKPSAAKAVNDQKKCSNCVVCYGHISDSHIASEKIDSEGQRVCPVDAVKRTNFSGGADGMFLYEQHHDECIGCAKCVKRCNEHGSASMFMIIRPDLCLGCNECAIATACPHNAVLRIPRESVDNYRGDYWFDQTYLMGGGA